jgi:branched-chain amino acid transport system ATP-binding protein
MAASFVGMTLLFGAAAAATGQALARNWRGAWQLLPYALLLAAGERFLLYALFGAALLSVTGYAVAVVILFAVAGLTYRVTQARRMTAQYPWLYERAGLFGWRERGSSR